MNLDLTVVGFLLVLAFLFGMAAVMAFAKPKSAKFGVSEAERTLAVVNEQPEEMRAVLARTAVVVATGVMGAENTLATEVAAKTSELGSASADLEDEIKANEAEIERLEAAIAEREDVIAGNEAETARLTGLRGAFV